MVRTANMHYAAYCSRDAYYISNIYDLGMKTEKNT